MEVRMSVKKITLTTLAIAIILAFCELSQKTFGRDDPNTSAGITKSGGNTDEKEQQAIAERAKFRMDILIEKLNLTEEQKKTIAPIVENQVKQMRMTRNDTILTIEKRKERMKAIRQTAHEKIRKVLTPEQQTKLDEMKEEWNEDAATRANRWMTRLTETLSLTDQQKKAIVPIIEKQVRDVMAARGDDTLSSEQKLERTKAIREASRKQINKILTPQQQAKYQEMIDKIHGRHEVEPKAKPQQ